ncbi:MAG: hypothetical protein SH850_08795, partial [Planctomycetaceae bacterium]|nr:hypothetical protein [Planctomycetaceae bacterium]
LGRFDEGRQAALQAVALESDSAVIAYLAGGASYWMGDYASAERFSDQALELECEAAFPLWIRALHLMARGRLDEAIVAAERGVLVGERQPLLLGVLGAVYGLARRTTAAEAILSELTARAAQEYIAPLWMADVCVGLGRTQEALDLLDEAHDHGNAFIHRASVAAEYDSLRDEPRFRALLARMGLSDVARTRPR